MKYIPLLILMLYSCNTSKHNTYSSKALLPFEPETAFIKGGTFEMGSNDGDDDEKPVHSVTLSNFAMGKYEVTNAQFVKFLNEQGNQKKTVLIG